MFLYNITINFNPERKDWILSWVKETIISGILSTGHFKTHKMFRLLNEVEGTGLTYSLQFFAENQTDVDNFRLHHEVVYLEQIANRLPGDLVYFISILSEE